MGLNDRLPARTLAQVRREMKDPELKREMELIYLGMSV
jgi:hypothetical protein